MPEISLPGLLFSTLSLFFQLKDAPLAHWLSGKENQKAVVLNEGFK